MDSVSNRFAPKSRMGKALVYTYTLLPRLSRYVLDGRYHIDNNRVENAIRPRGNRILPLQQLQGSRHRHPNLAGRHPQKDPNRKGH